MSIGKRTAKRDSKDFGADFVQIHGVVLLRGSQAACLAHGGMVLRCRGVASAV